MMRNVWRFFLLISFVSVLLTGCIVLGTTPPQFDAQPIADGKYQKKVDHLYFILDASSSMLEGHNEMEKFTLAKALVENFNKTMPGIDTNVALRSFGHDGKVSKKLSALMAEPAAYSPDALAKGLGKVTKAGGISPMNRALEGVGTDLKEVQDPIAIVVVSDGKDMPGNTLAAAQALKEAHGDKLCIYTAQVGNDAGGKKLLSKLAETTGCGKAVSADGLASGSAMNAFVKEVALAEMADSDGDGVPDDKDKCPDTPAGAKVDENGCALDSDKDGVPDYKDKCPDTPEGVKVDAEGCPIPVPTKSAEVTAEGTWIYKDIQFGVNKSDLKESSYPIVDEIVEALEAQPDLKIEIQGHTDSTGAHDYNVGLSQRRAKTVMSYLVSKGIDASRMTSKGFGPDRPIASNTTKDGRARNRRVEIKPLK